MDSKQFSDSSMNWTLLCGSPFFIVWDETKHSFGSCFQRLVLNAGSLALLAITSSYYIGKQTHRPTLPRTRRQKTIIWFRLLVTVCLLILSILQPCLLTFYAHVELFWADIFLYIVQVFSWSVHLAYLNALTVNLSRGTRGPKPVLCAWILTLISQIFDARLVWNTNVHLIYRESTELYDDILNEGLVTSQLILLVLYLCSIFPRGRVSDDELRNISRNADASEHTGLLSASVTHRNYSRFHEAFDPYYLGTAEEQVNFPSYLTFHWVNLLMKKGAHGNLESVDDLYNLPHHMRSEVISQKIQKAMMLNQPLSCDSVEFAYPKYSLLRALHKSYGIQFYAIGILKLISDSLNFAGPLLLHELVLYVEGEESIHWKGYASGIGICVASLVSSFCTVHFNYLLAKINVKLRASLITSVFRKIQHVSCSALSQFSAGEIVNMMSTDTDRVVNFCGSFHAFWSLPLQLGVTLVLLYRQIGLAFLAGVGVAVILIPVNRLIAVNIAKLSRKMLKFKDKRVQLMNEVLGMIKAVKLNSWENFFKRKIMDERYGEVKALAGRKYLDAVCVYLWAATPILIPLITFGIYAAVGNRMEPARVFTAVALFNMLIMPLNAFPWAINGLVEAWVSIKRIEKLMQVKEHDFNDYYTVVPEMSHKGSELQIVLIGASFSWNPSTGKELEAVPKSKIKHSKHSHIQPSSAVQPYSDEETLSAASPEVAVVSRARVISSSTCEAAIQEAEPYASTEQASKLSLENINIQLNKCQLIGIIGNVGSGKTALLNAILGELEKVSGVVSVAGLHQGFGLATQTPWLQNTSIKENIIFGQNFDPSRYRSVLRSCALEEDLEILPQGEDSNCGENGAALSGGQRARVALARAVYQNKNIYLLDDVLRGVDDQVSNQVMQQCIHGLLVGKTVILVTHNVSLLSRADWIIHMDNGSIYRQGSPKYLFPEMDVGSSGLSVDSNSSHPQASSGAIPRHSWKHPQEEKINFDYKALQDPAADESEESETRAFGELTASVYATYLSSVGASVCIMIFFSICLMQASRNLSDTWLAKWVSHGTPDNVTEIRLLKNGDDIDFGSTHPITHIYMPYYLVGGWITKDVVPQFYTYEERDELHMASVGLGMDPTTRFYFTVYGILAATNTVFVLIRAFLFAYGGICAAKMLHKKLLDAVLNSKMVFFDLNPLGRILNRFSTDVYNTDDILPFQANIFLAQLFGLIGSLVVTVYGMPWILLLYIPLMFVYYTTQDYYRHTSRDLRRIYALSLSPVYNHFTETLSGLTVIRALRAGHRFGVYADAYLEQNQRAQFCLAVVSQWLNLRLQLIGVGILAGVVLLSLWQHHMIGVSPGLVGLVISYALTINGFLNGVVTSLTETEREMISVERIHQYLEGATREAEKEVRSDNPPLALPFGWPNYGRIKFENVYLKYHSHNPYALRDVNLDIDATEKIGIVGRTGAGKSSLFMALFRLVELARGRISIDDVDISEINIKKLRANLAIISQDALIFSGTVRENLDPHGENLDRDILRAIDQCQMSAVVQEIGGLDAVLEQRGQNLSDGQKQLFCLVRAILCQTKIVCIDEGTSLLDRETDLKIQTVMRDAFRNKTVLIIAHRVHTVKDCDRVVIMSNGEIVEVGRPAELIEDENSLFHSMFSPQK